MHNLLLTLLQYRKQEVQCHEQFKKQKIKTLYFSCCFFFCTFYRVKHSVYEVYGRY